MENNINQEKYLQDMKETPSLESNKIFYNCSEFNSVIEIVKINEEFIEFKCNNNHEIKMNIKEYLDKIKENKLNNDVILKNSNLLKTYFANNTYGKNITEKTSVMAQNINAILAINGDYYGVQNTGYVLKNGKIYRNISSGREDLVIYKLNNIF